MVSGFLSVPHPHFLSIWGPISNANFVEDILASILLLTHPILKFGPMQPSVQVNKQGRLKALHVWRPVFSFKEGVGHTGSSRRMLPEKRTFTRSFLFGSWVRKAHISSFWALCLIPCLQVKYLQLFCFRESALRISKSKWNPGPGGGSKKEWKTQFYHPLPSALASLCSLFYSYPEN